MNRLIPSRSGLSARAGLAAVLVASAVLRAANLAALSSSPFFTRPVLDGAFCDQWASDILSGATASAPFYQDPLYPYLLALVYRLFGHSYLAVYLLQLLLGVLAAGLVFDMTRRLFGERAALAAGLVAAAYRPFIFYDGQFEKTSVAVALVTLWIWSAVLAAERRSAIGAFLSGTALGAACLTRGNLLAFVPIFPLLFLAAPAPPVAPPPGAFARTGPGRRTRAALALAGALAVVTPVSIRNSLLAGEPLLTTTMLGQNLYAGNNPVNQNGQNGTPPWVRVSPEFEEGDFAAYAERWEGRKLTRAEVSNFYVRASLRWARENPRDFVLLLGRKIALFLSRYEVPDNQDLDFFGRYSPILRWPLPGFGLVFALGAAGMALLRRRGPLESGLTVFFWVYGLATVLFFVLSRYRVVAVPALLPFAGASLAHLADGAVAAARSRRLRPLGAMLALVAAALALTFLPVRGVPSATAGAQTLANLASRLYHEGDVPGAERTFLEALTLDPRLGGALRSLGVLRFTKGEIGSAEGLLRRAVAVNADDAVARYYLGRVSESRGDLHAARAQYIAASRLLPGREDFVEALRRVESTLSAVPE